MRRMFGALIVIVSAVLGTVGYGGGVEGGMDIHLAAWLLRLSGYGVPVGIVICVWHARVRRIDAPDVGGLRSWSAHERITVRRA